MSEMMVGHVRGLTPAQGRVLLAMPANRSCDAWLLCWHLATLYLLEARGLIAQGRRGWLDAELTDLGRRIRHQLQLAVVYREAAE